MEESRKQEEISQKREIEKRVHPKTKEDFKVLLEELENWRIKEVQKVKGDGGLSAEEKQLALKSILDKETELLQTIDKLKIVANKENKQEKIRKFLKSMSDPKLWLRSDQRFTEVHTPFTLRAKELMEIYYGLKLKKVTIDERLDILLNTKWTIKE
jgi:hypothetical protein